ncbi:hypothetical protein TKK_0001140 [Trichogramma kaykai]|uniref:DnaJ homolog subfamily C member 22 n=1 Tax=Trichogramma kaykai TaxID=54128 RepID=A0ABD2WTL4_9HYME
MGEQKSMNFDNKQQSRTNGCGGGDSNNKTASSWSWTKDANNGSDSKTNGAKASSGTIKPSQKDDRKKSLFWAYFWWLFGGVFGAHHFYLERDDHALIWFCTLGGYFGCGWLRDIYRLPSYVADANDESEYVNWFKYRVRFYNKPPFASVRYVGATIVAYLFGQLFIMAIPGDEIYGINFRPLMILTPIAVAFGTWLVGNVGRERGSIWASLLVAYLFYPTLDYIGDETLWLGVMVVAATLAFDTFSKKWRLEKKPKQKPMRRVVVFVAFALVYSSMWTSYFYFNATLTDSLGEEVKVSEAIKHFLRSPIWLDLKTCLDETWRHARHHGFWATWRQIIDFTDPRGEINAYKVLGLAHTASQTEVTTRWRKLSRENHPDKCKGTEEERRQAQEKFMEIQEAYEILSNAKNRRQKKNKKSDHDL